ncbi:hypothetical protein NP493_119g00004 [Ridgeia piscesae]|uniref:Uncharacterized protein n=1 Tax=Ridgeia piscesae TaxID=27915 RepID=A0AAD9UGS4_RIDPI|nr:hypothetical protein NP493_119g00004 [Ridgeia piscesae]
MQQISCYTLLCWRIPDRNIHVCFNKFMFTDSVTQKQLPRIFKKPFLNNIFGTRLKTTYTRLIQKAMQIKATCVHT